MKFLKSPMMKEKKVKANNNIVKVRVENPVRWLMEVTENES